ncbi:MAG TPA: hypothetical protein VF844_06245 [Ktedonobacteraceae bacterium]
MITDGHEETQIGLENLGAEPVVREVPSKTIGLPQRREVAVNVRNLTHLRETVQEMTNVISLPPWWPTTNLLIAGIECTQATQFFDFNGQGSGNGTDNKPIPRSREGDNPARLPRPARLAMAAQSG